MSFQNTIDVLLIEDNRDLAENIVIFLEQKGHRVDTIYSGEKALALLEDNTYDILIVDIMLPGIDGFRLAKKIRSMNNIATPIVFLTARETLADKLEGFAAGADDYITKPFVLEELEARVVAVYRRTKGLVNQVAALGDWLVDESRLMITYKNESIVTTNIGFTLFHLLVLSYPNVLSRRELERKLWGDDPPDSDSLRSHVFILRKSIAMVCEHSVIETVHGVGFRLNID